MKRTSDGDVDNHSDSYSSGRVHGNDTNAQEQQPPPPPAFNDETSTRQATSSLSHTTSQKNFRGDDLVLFEHDILANQCYVEHDPLKKAETDGMTPLPPSAIASTPIGAQDGTIEVPGAMSMAQGTVNPQRRRRSSIVRPGAFPMGGRAPGSLPAWLRRSRVGNGAASAGALRDGEDGISEVVAVDDSSPLPARTVVSVESFRRRMTANAPLVEGTVPSDEQTTQTPCWRQNWRVLAAIVFAILALVGLAIGLVVTMGGGGGDSSSESVRISSPSVNTSRPTFLPTVFPTSVRTSNPTAHPTISPCGEGEMRIELLVVTDQFPDETSCEIADGNGTVVWVVQAVEFHESHKAHFFEKCLRKDCFSFTIHDYYANGICCDVGEGRYSIAVDGQDIKSGGEFESSETTVFGENCPTSSPTSSPLPTTYPTSFAPTVSAIPTSTTLPTVTTWIQVGFDIDGPRKGDFFGNSVSMSDDGSRVAVGAPGYDRDGYLRRGLVRIYEVDDGGNWTQIGKDLLGNATYDYFGEFLAISGDGERVAVGGVGWDEPSAMPGSGMPGIGMPAKVYQFENGDWELLGSPIDGEAVGDWFGTSLSLSGDGAIMAIGAPHNNDNGIRSGHVRVFECSSDSCTQLGDDIDGEAADDRSGYAVSLSKDGLTLAIGAPFHDGENGEKPDAGHVRVYTQNRSSWVQIGQDLDGEASSDWFGGAVSLSADGTVVAVGAPQSDGINGEKSGHVRVYRYENGTGAWSQLGGDIDGEAHNDLSGWSVSLSSDGTVVAVGAIWNDETSGHVRIYRFDRNAWVQIGADIDGEAADEFSGYAVSLSGNGLRVSIGAPWSDLNGRWSGRVRVYESPEI